MKSKRLLLLAALLGIITTFLVYYYLEGLTAAATSEATGKVLVARQDIPADTLVTAGMVEVARIPQEYIHPRAFSAPEQVVGGVTTAPIIAGEQLLRSKVVSEKEKSAALAYRIPPGKRAVSVPIDEISGVSKLIRVGDHVDVIGTVIIPRTNPATGQQEQKVFTVVTLQDVEILAIGQDLNDTGDSGNDAERLTATLAVTVAQAQPLIMANEQGTIRFLLRSPVDREIVPTIPFELENLLNGKAGES